MPAASTANSSRFSCRFAAGTSSGAQSGIWQIICSRKKPDVYVTVGRAGQVKASIHCPRPDRKTWKRHYRFDRNAPGPIADALRAANRIDSEMSWHGADMGKGRTLECRVMILGGGLSTSPIPVENDVRLLAPPAAGKCLSVALILGDVACPSEFPIFRDAETHLLASGALVDGRPIWLTYCYVEAPQLPSLGAGRAYRDDAALQSAGDIRTAMIAPNSDGSIVFIDTRVERPV